MLQVKKEIFNVVNYSHLEQLIIKVFGFKDYSIPADEELSNYISKTWYPSSLDTANWDEIKIMLETKTPIPCTLNTIMGYLAHENIIENVPHLINIYW